MCLTYLCGSVHGCLPLFFHLCFFAVCGGNFLGVSQTWVTRLLIQSPKQGPLKLEERLQSAWLTIESRMKTKILAPWMHMVGSSEGGIPPQCSIEIHLDIEDAQTGRLSNSGFFLGSRGGWVFILFLRLFFPLGLLMIWCDTVWQDNGNPLHLVSIYPLLVSDYNPLSYCLEKKSLSIVVY